MEEQKGENPNEEKDENLSPEEKMGKEQRKIAAQFDAGMKKLKALKGVGDQLGKKIKIPNKDMENLVDELLKEERESVGKEVKEDIKALLKSYMAFEGEVKKAQADLLNTITAKKKEFIQKMNNVFNKIENMDKLAGGFYSGLATAKGEETPNLEQK